MSTKFLSRSFIFSIGRQWCQIRNGSTSTGKVIVASKEPFCESLTKGTRYSWCTCGLSHKQPFCDGSHKGSGMRPHRMKAEETCEVFFCGCKQTKTPPYCDGSHMSDDVQACVIGSSLS
ncbi:CDGSH iron-sulfur domain-containing protein 3, mitochondrial-like [Clytia hemisphaerica]|uniref:Iron-binding zinc finger CDGSH type domain-containing protein n=1 Tax=Clytia hemisphaerica TaxID=252671 RepID=A0A7M5TSC2_9CNID